MRGGTSETHVEHPKENVLSSHTRGQPNTATVSFPQTLWMSSRSGFGAPRMHRLHRGVRPPRALLYMVPSGDLVQNQVQRCAAESCDHEGHKQKKEQLAPRVLEHRGWRTWSARQTALASACHESDTEHTQWHTQCARQISLTVARREKNSRGGSGPRRLCWELRIGAHHLNFGLNDRHRSGGCGIILHSSRHNEASGGDCPSGRFPLALDCGANFMLEMVAMHRKRHAPELLPRNVRRVLSGEYCAEDGPLHELCVFVTLCSHTSKLTCTSVCLAIPSSAGLLSPSTNGSHVCHRRAEQVSASRLKTLDAFRSESRNVNNGFRPDENELNGVGMRRDAIVCASDAAVRHSAEHLVVAPSCHRCMPSPFYEKSPARAPDYMPSSHVMNCRLAASAPKDLDCDSVAWGWSRSLQVRETVASGSTDQGDPGQHQASLRFLHGSDSDLLQHSKNVWLEHSPWESFTVNSFHCSGPGGSFSGCWRCARFAEHTGISKSMMTRPSDITQTEAAISVSRQQVKSRAMRATACQPKCWQKACPQLVSIYVVSRQDFMRQIHTPTPRQTEAHRDLWVTCSENTTGGRRQSNHFVKHWNTTLEIAQSAGEAEFDGIVNRGQNCLGMRNSMRDLQSQVQIITKIVASPKMIDCFGWQFRQGWAHWRHSTLDEESGGTEDEV